MNSHNTYVSWNLSKFLKPSRENTFYVEKKEYKASGQFKKQKHFIVTNSLLTMSFRIKNSHRVTA